MDLTARTIAFSYDTPAAGSESGVVRVSYRTSTVYLHTVSASYDDGGGGGPCGSSGGQIELCAQVQAINAYAGDVTSVSTIIDSISETGASANGPYAYGTVTSA